MMRMCGHEKRVSYLHRTAQLPTVASIKTWRSSGRAGRVGLTRCKGTNFFLSGNYFGGIFCNNELKGLVERAHTLIYKGGGNFIFFGEGSEISWNCSKFVI